jgi:predicted nucleotidyltransferase
MQSASFAYVARGQPTGTTRTGGFHLPYVCCVIIIAAMTDAEPQNEPVLKRFRAAVAEVYGDRLERVILYGSRARGDHQPDSDYDIAVFIKDPGSFYDESGRLAAITTDILEDTAAVISATPFAAGAYRERSGFMHELRKDGLDL